ncbi:MAG: AMP-binding protein [Caldilineaceae bacterium]
MNIVGLLDTITMTTPEQVALIHGAERITYRELNHRSQAVGAFLQAQGLQPGQRALLMVPLSIDLYVIFLGLVRVGATVVLIDPAVGKAQLAACCAQAQPDLFIGSPKAHLLRLIHAPIRRIPRKFTLGWGLPGGPALRTHSVTTPCRDAPAMPDDPALITFTSGSTALPKAICRTHGFLLHQHQVLCRTLTANLGAVEMNTLPVFILSSLARGITVVIPKGFTGRPNSINAADVVRELQEHQCTRLLAAPAFCQRLVDQLAATAQTLPTIDQVYTGGGPVFPALFAKLQQGLPNATIYAVYGSTEAEPIAHLNLSTLLPTDWQMMQRGHGLLAGKPVAEIELAILPDQVGQPIGPFTVETFAAAALPVHCAGEIVVTGAHVQKSYIDGGHGDDRLTKFRVGETIWHRTGDAGYLDEVGRLWLLGRCAARMGQGATARYPFGIEAAAMSHVGVERAALVEVDGAAVLAVQTSNGEWGKLQRQLADALPTVDRIQRLVVIPVDARHGSKVLYGKVQELVRG